MTKLATTTTTRFFIFNYFPTMSLPSRTLWPEWRLNHGCRHFVIVHLPSRTATRLMWLLWYFCTQTQHLHLAQQLCFCGHASPTSLELAMPCGAEISMGFAQLAGGGRRHLTYAYRTFQ
jgi:hypothetical protein